MNKYCKQCLYSHYYNPTNQDGVLGLCSSSKVKQAYPSYRVSNYGISKLAITTKVLATCKLLEVRLVIL